VATFRGTLPLAAPAGGLSGEGDGQDEQQSTKKNTMKTDTTSKIERKALGQSEQFRAQTEASKYIVIQLPDREQVITFPQAIKHVDALAAVKRQHPTATAISAGFYLYDEGALWTGGMSDTLNLASRKADNALVLAFIGNPEAEFVFIAGGVQ
jgi:hypothetical protein